MKETIVQIICVLGSMAIFLAAVGLARLPDFFARTHAATKASAFGLACFLFAACLIFPQPNFILKAIFALAALFLTLPVATQALADAVRSSPRPDDSQHD